MAVSTLPPPCQPRCQPCQSHFLAAQLGSVPVPLARCSCRPSRRHPAAAGAAAADPTSEAEGWHVALEDATIGCELQAILEALLPLGGTAGGQPLHLLLEGCSLDAAACSRSCPALAQLHGLSLIDLEAEQGDIAGLLQALLRQAPRLRALTIDESAGEGQVPRCVVELQGLTSLSLEAMGLESLPRGAYLDCEWVCGAGRCLVCVAAAPTAPGELVRASLCCRRLHSPVPSACPAGLESLAVPFNAFKRLSDLAAVTAATRLTCLKASGRRKRGPLSPLSPSPGCVPSLLGSWACCTDRALRCRPLHCSLTTANSWS